LSCRIMGNLTLLTDLYELTMVGGYFAQGKCRQTAVFDLFFRHPPFNSTFCVAAGLEQAVQYVMNINFGTTEIDYLYSLRMFPDDFLDYMKTFRFTGDLYAVPEGRAVFPKTPMVVVKAPIAEAQFIETALLNIMNFQTLIATKASRIYRAAEYGNVIEFGARRAHGPDGALSATRAAFVGGCRGTSNVQGGLKYGIPVKGTMAHSWVMSFKSELEAFRNYAEVYPKGTVLLVDTYNTLESGLPNAIIVGKELEAKGHRFLGIRLDSGDLAYLAMECSIRLDQAGLDKARIVISNNLDEEVIRQVLSDIRTMAAENGVDGERIIRRLDYGVGTHLVTSHGWSHLGGVYKLAAVEVNGQLVPKIKISDNPDKTTDPGHKHLYRFFRDGEMQLDLLALADEPLEHGTTVDAFHPQFPWKHIRLLSSDTFEPMHETIIRDGELVYKFPSLPEIQQRMEEDMARMHPTYKRMTNPHLYKVSLTSELSALKQRLLHQNRMERNHQNAHSAAGAAQSES